MMIYSDAIYQYSLLFAINKKKKCREGFWSRVGRGRVGVCSLLFAIICCCIIPAANRGIANRHCSAKFETLS
jgi:hypothetical protein